MRDAFTNKLLTATTTVGDEDDGDESPPIIIRRTSAQLICLLCGRPSGTLTRDDDGPWSFIPAGSENMARVASNVRGMRCTHCGGSLHIDQVETQNHRKERRVSMEHTRRGRPPKWLQTLRQREALHRLERAS